jgi:hypothetical protein
LSSYNSSQQKTETNLGIIKNLKTLQKSLENTGKSARRGGRTTTYNMAPELKPEQTFDIVLPNLIHKSKKRNLK